VEQRDRRSAISATRVLRAARNKRELENITIGNADFIGRMRSMEGEGGDDWPLCGWAMYGRKFEARRTFQTIST